MVPFPNSPFGRTDVDVKQVSAIGDYLIITNTFKFDEPIEDVEVFRFDDEGRIIDITMFWSDMDLLAKILKG